MLEFKQKTKSKLEFVEAIKKPIPIKCIQINEPFKVYTIEGIMNGKSGDWLMVGVKGEMYPCSKEIFEATYDVIE